jgi:hypothetical protein
MITALEAAETRHRLSLPARPRSKDGLPGPKAIPAG